MMLDQKIVFIGPGVMAEGILAALIREEVTAPENIGVAGPRPDRGIELQQKYGIEYFQDNAQAVRTADVVLLSVKPQRLDKVMAGLKGQLKTEALILSIVAGASLSKLTHGLGHTRIVRSMPNTPAQIGMGITVWTAAADVSPEQLETARQVLSAMGEQVFVEDENYLDMATALSGTGPAYVFLFMEALVDAGVHMGFPRRISEQLVIQTVRGSVEYYLQRNDPVHLTKLRNDVTSPGGTTAAALYFLEKAGFRTALSRAVWAAYERSRELGRGAKNHSPEETSS